MLNAAPTPDELLSDMFHIPTGLLTTLGPQIPPNDVLVMHKLCQLLGFQTRRY